MEKAIWITQNGRKIPIDQMTNNHLLNTHRFVRRKLVEANELEMFAYSPFAPSEGTIAADDLEKCLNDLWEQKFALSSWEERIDKDIARRNLEPLYVDPPKPMPKIK